jgi:chromosome segregation ATPase
MSERREPTVSRVGFDEDEVGLTVTRTPKAVSARVDRYPVSASPLAPLALVAGLLALAGVAWLVWQQQQFETLYQTGQTGNQTQQQLVDTRLQDLEKKLALTGDTSQQSVASLTAILKSLETSVKSQGDEIRKLWTQSNDQQRVLADTKKRLDDTIKSTASLNQAFDGVKNALEAEQKALKSALADVKAELAVLGEVQESQQAAFSKTQSIGAEFQGLKTDLNRRIAANEEAIRAFDAFRVQVNRQLLQMSPRAQ